MNARGDAQDADEDVRPEELPNARIKLWFCPLDAEHRKEESGIRPMVEWDGDIATCLICGARNDGTGTA